MSSIIGKLYQATFVRFSKHYSRKGLSAFLDQVIDRYVRPRVEPRILHVGASGAISEHLKDSGVQCLSIDIDPERKPDVVADVQNMPEVASDSIDVVFLMEVLEHVPNPVSAVEEIQRVLKPGGVLIGSTPFIFPIHDEPHDYYRYTKYGLLHLFREFETKHLEEKNSYLEGVWVLLVRLLNSGGRRDRLKAVVLMPFFVTALPLLKILSPLITVRFATTGYVFVFKKLTSSDLARLFDVTARHVVP